jgi:hypothetical protein
MYSLKVQKSWWLKYVGYALRNSANMPEATSKILQQFLLHYYIKFALYNHFLI